ncbi:PEP-CTERM sorting domain-containing protein [Armatimonas sp.]|uniref:PEP-CTERM sorting domain-containing protein n=1 Tax=Armatimonas sp. TaxID=1872638 RepID=UPI00286A0F1B|nr:PEP-CTERM sorting domain-containing protein [Armatimonas sp.]
MNTTRFSFLSALALLTLAALPQATQAQTFANWATSTSGNLGGVNIGVSGFNNPTLVAYDLSGASYSAAPGSASQQSLDYSTSSSWTVTFASPISNLNLYIVSWRGNLSGGPNPTTYTFNQTISVASGMAGATVAGNLLTVPDSGLASLASGILNFASPVTTLSVTTSGTFGQVQALNFSTSVSSSAPEPGTLAFLALGGTLVLVRRRRK